MSEADQAPSAPACTVERSIQAPDVPAGKCSSLTGKPASAVPRKETRFPYVTAVGVAVMVTPPVSCTTTVPPKLRVPVWRKM
jgi:hypothetical protein